MRKRSGDLLLAGDARGCAGAWNCAVKLRQLNTERSLQPIGLSEFQCIRGTLL
jgi:hypothetical protein